MTPAPACWQPGYDIDYWDESSLGCSGLNPVVQAASAQLLADGDEPLLVLHGDLPLLTAADISAVLRCQRQLAGLVIACDLAGTGTNLLAFTRDSVPQFRFGVDSCAMTSGISAQHWCAGASSATIGYRTGCG